MHYYKIMDSMEELFNAEFNEDDNIVVVATRKELVRNPVLPSWMCDFNIIDPDTIHFSMAESNQ